VPKERKGVEDILKPTELWDVHVAENTLRSSSGSLEEKLKVERTYEIEWEAILNVLSVIEYVLFVSHNVIINKNRNDFILIYFFFRIFNIEETFAFIIFLVSAV
jgi:hypothetical protein